MASPGKGTLNLPQKLRRLISRHQQYPDMDRHETPGITNIGEPDVQLSRWPNSRLKVTRSPTLEVPGKDFRGGATRPSIVIARPGVNMAPGSIRRSDTEDDVVLLEPKSTNALTVENLERLQIYLEYLEVLEESRYGDLWLTDPPEHFRDTTKDKAINDWTHKVSAAIRSKSTQDNDNAAQEEYTELILRRYREEDEPVVPGLVF